MKSIFSISIVVAILSKFSQASVKFCSGLVSDATSFKEFCSGYGTIEQFKEKYSGALSQGNVPISPGEPTPALHPDRQVVDPIQARNLKIMTLRSLLPPTKEVWNLEVFEKVATVIELIAKHQQPTSAFKQNLITFIRGGKASFSDPQLKSAANDLQSTLRRLRTQESGQIVKKSLPAVAFNRLFLSNAEIADISRAAFGSVMPKNFEKDVFIAYVKKLAEGLHSKNFVAPNLASKLTQAEIPPEQQPMASAYIKLIQWFLSVEKGVKGSQAKINKMKTTLMSSLSDMAELDLSKASPQIKEKVQHIIVLANDIKKDILNANQSAELGRQPESAGPRHVSFFV